MHETKSVTVKRRSTDLNHSSPIVADKRLDVLTISHFYRIAASGI
jgi:hypothetical protein